MEVKLRTLPTQVAGVLVRRIASGELPEGRVPSEQEVLLEFGVSRAVAREALKILASLDMVDIAQGRRVTLRPAAEWDYLSPLLIEWLPAEQLRELLHELHEARLIFEPAIASEAALGIGDKSLAYLGKLLDGMATHENAPNRYLELDLEFHMEICRATNNRILDRFMYSSRWWMSASRRVSNKAPDALPAATAEHRRIFAALAAHDSVAAETAMRDHLATNRMFVIDEPAAFEQAHA